MHSNMEIGWEQILIWIIAHHLSSSHHFHHHQDGCVQLGHSDPGSNIYLFGKQIIHSVHGRALWQQDQRPPIHVLLDRQLNNSSEHSGALIYSISLSRGMCSHFLTAHLWGRKYDSNAWQFYWVLCVTLVLHFLHRSTYYILWMPLAVDQGHDTHSRSPYTDSILLAR